MQDAQDGLQPIASPYPPFRYAVLVIAILMVVTMLGQLDRNLPFSDRCSAGLSTASTGRCS